MTITDCLDQIEAASRDLRLLLVGGDPVPVPVPPVTGGDAFDVSRAVHHDGPSFVNWPATARITALEFGPDGVRVDFTKHDGLDRWPDVRPAGWTGDLQYCFGMAMRIDGTWHVSAPIQCWHDLERSGGNIGDANPLRDGRGQVLANWFYAPDRWGPLCRQPAAGELVGFFVVAGSVRGGSEAVSVEERSNVVVVPFPTEIGASYSF
jgi:hypothetical protein